MKGVYIFLLAFSPALVSAHPGHGVFNGFSFQHFICSPLHLVSIVVLVVFFILVSKRRKKAVTTK